MSMKVILLGFLAGIFGTIIMDLTNSILKRLNVIRSINLRGIGRLAHGWVRGKIIHDGKTPIPPVRNELAKGIVAHYSIGAGFGVFFAAGTAFAGIDLGVVLSAIVFGLTATLAAWFVHFPALGWGIMGLKAPESKWTFTSFVNHINYGIGLAIGMKVIKDILAAGTVRL